MNPEGHTTPFADRLGALVRARGSQLCLGLDPDPSALTERGHRVGEALVNEPPTVRAAAAITEHCRELIETVGDVCVAIKPQVACFERLGPPGWQALLDVSESARAAGLLVVADGKRGDVPVTARAYGQAMFGGTPTPWGSAGGLGADAATVNPMLGEDALEPFVEVAAAHGGGLFALVRTSNPGAGAIQDTGSEPLHRRLAAMVDRLGDRLPGSGSLTGMGAVVGATAPDRFEQLRALAPRAIFLVPGIGAQGGLPEDLGPLFGGEPAAALVPVSRSIAQAPDPLRAAEDLRAAVWAVGGR
ncbi:MAG: orotidine-5'-phosphate decarboxylase [Solirubrobacterales bacterium]